jgi:hypothetical protein
MNDGKIHGWLARLVEPQMPIQERIDSTLSELVEEDVRIKAVLWRDWNGRQ